MGKHLHEVLGWAGPMTYRQYRAWQAWLETQWNEPSRADHYQMQTAQSVDLSRGVSKDLGKYEIPFNFVERQQQKVQSKLTPIPEAGIVPLTQEKIDKVRTAMMKAQREGQARAAKRPFPLTRS